MSYLKDQKKTSSNSSSWMFLLPLISFFFFKLFLMSSQTFIDLILHFRSLNFFRFFTLMKIFISLAYMTSWIMTSCVDLVAMYLKHFSTIDLQTELGMKKLLLLCILSSTFSLIFLIASLISPDWLNSDSNLGMTSHRQWHHLITLTGSVRIGLLSICRKLPSGDEVCSSQDHLIEWIFCVFSIIICIILIICVIVFVITSSIRPSLANLARRCCFIAIGLLCLVGVLFPFGFRHPEVGGKSFKLPEIWDLGICYQILWTSSLLLLIASWTFLRLHLRVWVISF